MVVCKLSFNVCYAASRGQIGEKYKYAGRAVCAYVHAFRKRPGCALIGACALIRTNTVFLFYKNAMFCFVASEPERGSPIFLWGMPLLAESPLNLREWSFCDKNGTYIYLN